MPTLNIGNLVWKDLDADGFVDNGEPGVAGVKVVLYSDNGATPGVFDGTDTMLAMQNTDVNGLYNFTSLAAGNYFVRVDPSNFSGAGMLLNCTSSVGNVTGDSNTNNADHGMDDGAPAANGIVSTVITLAATTEPDIAFDGDGTNGNQTIDFGFSLQLALGNLVWKDLDGDGVRDTVSPNEPAIPNVKVSLFQDVNNNDVFDAGTDTQVGATVMTDPGGLYNFAGLLPGKYFVRIDASNFQAGGALLGCVSSLSAANPNTNTTDSADNGVDDPNPAANAIFSGVVALKGFSEPDTPADTDGANGDLTVDFSFIPKMSLGNLVWKDYNNDSLKQALEPGIAGVEIHLYLDLDNSGSFDPAYDRDVANTATIAGGLYSFTDLSPGNYFVHISAVNFQPLGKLEGCMSSAPNDAGDTVDNNDNGATVTDPGTLDTAPAITGIASNLIALIGFSEPDTAAGTAIRDADSNATVDFGFYAQCVSNLVFSDDGAGTAANYDNGKKDAGEGFLSGVTVKLYASNGTTEINVGPDGILNTTDDAAGGVATDSNGEYKLGGLPQGDYRAEAAIKPGYKSSADVAAQTATPNGNHNDDDNGVGVGTTTALSNSITLTPGAAGALSNNIVDNATASTTNPTLDFGQVPRGISIGNVVWFDTDGNGQSSATEKGKDGALVELFLDSSGDGTLTGGEQTPVARQLTTGGGFYLFTQATDAAGVGTGNPLLPGKYFVGVSVYNFLPAGAPATINAQPFMAGMLAGYTSSGVSINNAGVISEAAIAGNQTTDNDQDNYDDGLKQGAGFYASGVLSGLLNIVASLEPANETTTLMPGATGGATPGHNNTIDGTAGGAPILDANSNITVDFGFFSDCLSNQVFNDNGAGGGTVNDGLKNGGEPGVNGVTVQLFSANGLVEINVGPDGTLGTADDAPGGVTTATISAPVVVDGSYKFQGLPPGQYTVKVTIPAGFVSAKDAATTANPDNNTDNDDNIAGTGGGLQTSPPITITPGAEPIVDPNTGNTTNNTLDFAIVRVYSLGNRVWRDLNNDGTIDVADGLTPGLNGVAVRVLNAAGLTPVVNVDGVTVANQTTAGASGGGGYYRFDKLLAGDYVVEVVQSNFSGALAGYASSGGGVQQNNAGPEMLIVLPATLSAVAGSGAAQGGSGAVTIVNSQRIEWNGSLQPGERVVVTYKVQLANSVQSGVELCIPTTANFDADLNGANETAITINTCVTANCQPIGPGTQTTPGSSALFFPIYTSSPSNPNVQNTRINLTNVNTANSQTVHLFFVDGATCSVSDQYICLTPNQTTSFVMSDLDPGTTGYAIAVAVDQTGCPVAANFLLGDEYVKFDTGHAANLKAEGAAALPGGLPACQVGSSTAVLNFDGVSYSQLPRVVAVSGIPDRASGNDTMLILNRISGNAATGMDRLGAIFGLLYDDAETPYSFSFTPSSCQFRSSISNNFPRTTPRFEQVIAAGRSGWMRLWSQSDAPITGALINRNPNAASSSQAYNQGHSLHTLTTSQSGSITIPVFPPSC